MRSYPIVHAFGHESLSADFHNQKEDASMKMRTVHSPKVISPAAGVKSNCKVYNNQVFISGMTARQLDGSVPTGMYAQARAAFQKIKDLMEAAGGKMNDIVQISIFATEMSVDEFWKARREFFSGDFPCSTFVQVVALATPQLVVEVNAIGFIGAGE
jgi:2-iminobutanoate/2-iminopropanoate deaminase